MTTGANGGIPYAEVIGDPIAHSKSPLTHKFWLEKRGIRGDYRALQVRADELEDYFARRRADAEWRGCNLTAPHKVSAMKHVRVQRGTRQMSGAVNIAFPAADGGIDGGNTDIFGIGEALESLEPGCDMALIGAGGAARAALFATMPVARRIFVLNRSVAKATALLDELGIPGEALPLDASLPPVGLLVNASVLGMSDQPALDVSLETLLPNAIVFDMVYAPHETRLLSRARALRLRTVDGLQMLVAQAAAAFEVFFGQPAPREHDAELRTLLTQ